MDFETEGLLDGLSGEERGARLRLLERLLREGTPAAELKAAVAEDRLALLPVERLLDGNYTAAEVQEQSGLDAAFVRRIRRLAGLPEVDPEQPVFTAEDVAAARAVKSFLDAGLDEEAIAQITRVLGEGSSRLAATVSAAFGEAFLQPGDSEEDVALRFAALAKQLTPSLAPVLEATFKDHLREAVRRAMIGPAQRRTGQVGDAQELAVCFADLVGFTRLGGRVEVGELGTVAGRLSELAGDVAQPPVRLVKTIGDAAMFVSAEAPALVQAMLRLLQATKEEELPQLRAGIALGPALQRAGDFYGHSVNLASRVTGVARPETVLCTEETREAACEQVEFSFAGRHRLKGVKGPQPLYRARGATGEAQAAED